MFLRTPPKVPKYTKVAGLRRPPHQKQGLPSTERERRGRASFSQQPCAGTATARRTRTAGICSHQSIGTARRSLLGRCRPLSRPPSPRSGRGPAACRSPGNSPSQSPLPGPHPRSPSPRAGNTRGPRARRAALTAGRGTRRTERRSAQRHRGGRARFGWELKGLRAGIHLGFFFPFRFPGPVAPPVSPAGVGAAVRAGPPWQRGCGLWQRVSSRALGALGCQSVPAGNKGKMGSLFSQANRDKDKRT